LKLINAISSDFYGRIYLLKSPKVIPTIIHVLQNEVTDSIIRQNALGALQKLSLKKETQLVMINHDLIRWIIETMKSEKGIMSEYSLEYATALFMNLSLRTEGKKKCEERIFVLETLMSYLQHSNIQVRTFVNGSLYSLFTRKKLRLQALELGIDIVLRRIVNNEDERIRNQIKYILEQLEKSEDDGENQEESFSEDNEGELDDYEDEEEIGDDGIDDNLPEQKNFIGEVLLKQYILPVPSNLQPPDYFMNIQRKEPSFVTNFTKPLEAKEQE